MLKQRPLSRAGRACGLLLIAALGGFGGYAAWAAQAPRAAHAPDATAERVDAHLDVTFGAGKPSSVRLAGAVGAPIEVAATEGGIPWRMAFVAARDGEAIALEATVTRDGRVVAKPSLVAIEGRTATIEYGAHDSPDHFRLDATLFLHPPGWRPDTGTADAVADRAASEDIHSRVAQSPVYPPAAIAARPSGHVEPRVSVDADWHPRSATVARPRAAGSGRDVR